MRIYVTFLLRNYVRVIKNTAHATYVNLPCSSGILYWLKFSLSWLECWFCFCCVGVLSASPMADAAKICWMWICLVLSFLPLYPPNVLVFVRQSAWRSFIEFFSHKRFVKCLLLKIECAIVTICYEGTNATLQEDFKHLKTFKAFKLLSI